MLELEIGKLTELALVKDVQKDPVHQIIEHLDLIVVKQGEKVQVEVPVLVEGEPASGTIADLDATTLSLEVEATHIPENVVESSRASRTAPSSSRATSSCPGARPSSTTPRCSSSTCTCRRRSTWAGGRRGREIEAAEAEAAEGAEESAEGESAE